MARFIVLLVVFMVFASVFGKVCTPEDREPRICTKELRLGCVCYTDGTCVQKMCNQCSDCINPSIVSIDYGACPGVSEEKKIIETDLAN